METVIAPALLICNADIEDDISSCSPTDEAEQNQGKDSGVDCSHDTSVLPDEKTTLMVRKAVEFYFADENIINDPFLLKHVKRNKEGLVSLKLISSFKKVRSLCRNWKIVAHCLQQSEFLILNKEGTKVRRKEPLPCETKLTKTVITYPLPKDKASEDMIGVICSLFASCGPIASVRMLRQGCSVEPNIKQFFMKNPEAQSKDCGLVEFEEFAGAQCALALDSIELFHVLPLLEKDDPMKENGSPKRESPKKKKKTKRHLQGFKKNLDDSEDGESTKKEQRSRRSSSGSLGYTSSSSSGYLSSSPVDNWFLRRHSYHTTGAYLEPATPSFASLANRTFSKNPKSRFNKDTLKACDLSETESPWKRRQKLENRMDLSSSLVNLAVPIKTLRLPRGPDGSRGFQPRLTSSVEE